MAKQIIWRIQTEDAEHIVTYTLHRLTGRMTVPPSTGATSETTVWIRGTTASWRT